MFLARFIQYIQFEKRYSAHTVSAYQSDLDQFIAFLSTSGQPPTHPNEVSHHDIRNWMVSMMDDSLTARSINRKIATLRKYFKFLLQEGVIETNPSSKIIAPKIPKNLPVIVEDAKLSQMLDSDDIFTDDFKGVRDKLVIEFLFGTGIRLAELVGVKETDINTYEHTVKVLGKRNKERIIPVNKELSNLLSLYLMLKKSENFNNNSLTLIVTDKGATAYPKLIYLIVHKYLSYISTQNKK
ncbi:integrase [archaeon]|nr:MAG: integrase [archaeon]